jgi:acid stress-induced BolA-like protein IbaG/YrbA
MLSAEQLKTYIMNGLPCEHVEVRGDDGTHFEAVVVSGEFVGKNMVQQHQMVYKALGDRMREEIHALSLRTFMPSQWNK